MSSSTRLCPLPSFLASCASLQLEQSGFHRPITQAQKLRLRTNPSNGRSNRGKATHDVVIAAINMEDIANLG